MWLFACAHGAAQVPREQVGGRVPFEFQIRNVPVPFPVARALVAGVPTLAVLDTGSETHVVAGWFASKLNLPVASSNADVHDPTGRPLSLRELANPQLALEGFGPLPAHAAMVIDLPGFFEKGGIGLIVSPQLLAAKGEAVVIDIPGRGLWREPEATAMSRAGAGQQLLAAGQSVTLPRTSGLAYLVPATIDSERAQLVLDTGADETCLVSVSTAARNIVARHKSHPVLGYAASGESKDLQTPPLKLMVGAVERIVPIGIVSNDGKNPVQDGQLGMDVLKSCVVVLSRPGAVVRCQPAS
jgi:hypothetical protein